MRQNTYLTGKVAVITAASTHIGLALAASAAQRGMKLALVDPDTDRLNAALKQFRHNGTPIMGVCADTGDLTETHNLAQSIERELGPPWLVCNHSETSVELNQRAIIHGVQVFAPILARRAQGHIVNLISADRASASCPAFYVAARHAMVGISTSLYRELDSMGSPVGVSLVCHAQMNRHSSIFPSSPLNRARHRAAEAPHPERLAEEIFAAVKTRCFWVFCDRAASTSPDLLDARQAGGARREPSASEGFCPSEGQLGGLARNGLLGHRQPGAPSRPEWH